MVKQDLTSFFLQALFFYWPYSTLKIKIKNLIRINQLLKIEFKVNFKQNEIIYNVNFKILKFDLSSYIFFINPFNTTY